MIAFITGSNFYEFPGFKEEEVTTRFGRAAFLRGKSGGTEVLLLPRHGAGHRKLPHHINYRANLAALKEAGATAILSCSVCGVVNATLPLASPMIAEDLYFPENRLADGSACTIFTKTGETGRGHLLAGSLFNPSLNRAVEESWSRAGRKVTKGVYGHVIGPRFNTRSEIRGFIRNEVDFISQTCGPEAVLANELELPFALAAFAVDYANGVQPEPTPVETLQSNLSIAQAAFFHLVEDLPTRIVEFSFENFVYRFDS